jgi:hypothetical protein
MDGIAILKIIEGKYFAFGKRGKFLGVRLGQISKGATQAVVG